MQKRTVILWIYDRIGQKILKFLKKSFQTLGYICNISIKSVKVISGQIKTSITHESFHI